MGSRHAVLLVPTDRLGVVGSEGLISPYPSVPRQARLK
jgi:hypothetical protein